MINGGKVFITSGKIAGWVILFAGMQGTGGRDGITAFLTPTASGYVVENVEDKLGQAASDTCTLRFEEMFVPDAMRIGEEGEGYKIALSSLETGRTGIAAQSIGMAEAALNAAIAYGRERRSFGRPIIEHQAVGFRLAEALTRLEAARQLVLHAA